MDRRIWSLIAVAALGWAVGCTRTTEELRTFNESHDGDGATAEVTDAGEPGTAGSVAVVQVEPAIDEDSAEPLAAPPAEEDDVAAAESVASSRPPRVPLPVRIADAGASETVAAAPTGPLEIKLLVPEKDFARVDSGKSLRVSYDDLDLIKVLNMEPVPEDCTKHFPDWLKSLDGMQVRIRGFMIPPPRETELPVFTLARDNQICCFGRDPKVYDIIPVFLKDGTTTNYIPNRPFDVVGRFYIRPDAYRGELQTLYEIEDAEVITN